MDDVEFLELDVSHRLRSVYVSESISCNLNIFSTMTQSVGAHRSQTAPVYLHCS